MKGISSRQKMIVRPKESTDKYLTQQKNLRKAGPHDHRYIASRKGSKFGGGSKSTG